MVLQKCIKCTVHFLLYLSNLQWSSSVLAEMYLANLLNIARNISEEYMRTIKLIKIDLEIRQIWFCTATFYTRVCIFHTRVWHYSYNHTCSMQAHTWSVELPEERVVIWILKDIFHTRVYNSILEYGTVCEKTFESKNSKLEYVFPYLKYGNKLKDLGSLWMAYTRVWNLILEYGL